MPKPDLPLTYNYQPAQKEAEIAPVVLMVHGYGSHENDLFAMHQALPAAAHYVSVRAPRNLGMGGFAWYDINFNQVGDKINNLEQAKQSLALLRQFVLEFREAFALQNSPLWLMGFSQGTILSYGYALSHPTEVAKVMALSGYVLKGLVPEHYQPKELQHLNFFVSHGTQDEILPVTAARQTVAFLEKLQISHVYHEYPVGHGVSPENMQALKEWFKQQLTKV
jgi:phospholipase/carboxylesterase